MFEFDAKFQAKLAEMRAAGVQPYPTAAGMRASHISTDLHERYLDVEDPSTVAESADVSLTGRVMFRNRMGKLLFLRIQDSGEDRIETTNADGEPERLGGRIQVMIRKNDVGEDAYEVLKKLDIGDFVYVRGKVVRTRTGELTLAASEARLASKIISPFPDRFHSVTDQETRHRQRYVDLFMNAEVRRTFRLRSKIIRHIRSFFEGRDFMEVETPMMQAIAGGAAARPFETHHNALDIGLFLRVAPELYLKRLVVGGFERVFELNRNFRNEGISLKHNPEFTMLEFYMAWATYTELMDLTETLLVELARDVVGQMQVQLGAHLIDFSPPYRRAPMGDLIVEHAGIDAGSLRDPKALEAFWRKNQSVAEDESLPTTWGKWS